METSSRKNPETLTVHEGRTLAKEETHRSVWHPQLVIFHSQFHSQGPPGVSWGLQALVSFCMRLEWVGLYQTLSDPVLKSLVVCESLRRVKKGIKVGYDWDTLYTCLKLSNKKQNYPKNVIGCTVVQNRAMLLTSEQSNLLEVNGVYRRRYQSQLFWLWCVIDTANMLEEI